MELIPHSCGLKLTQLESLAELERAGTSTEQSFASADFTLVLWVQPKPPPLCPSPQLPGDPSGAVTGEGLDGAWEWSLWLVWRECAFSSLPSAQKAAFLVRQLPRLHSLRELFSFF